MALIAGIVAHTWQAGFDGALVALAGAAVGMALLLPFYAIKAVGAGDVKLLSCLGAVVGVQLLISVALYGAVIGGLMSAVILVRRKRLLLFFQETAVMGRAPTRSGATAPYAVAIASGVYLSLVLPSVLG